MGSYLYLIVLFLLLILPVSYTFSKKLRFYINLKALFATVVLLGLIFIGFEAVLISRDVIKFNPLSTLEQTYIGVPVEQFLYYIVVPYTIIVIYELVRLASKKNVQLYATSTTIVGIGLFLLLFTLLNIWREYTFVVGLGVIATVAIFARQPALQNTDVVIYKIGSFLVFFMLQTVLNSFGILSYNSADITDFRIGSVPVESLLYSYILISLYLVVYDAFKKGLTSTSRPR